jgi:hypothetical protein
VRKRVRERGTGELLPRQGVDETHVLSGIGERLSDASRTTSDAALLRASHVPSSHGVFDVSAILTHILVFQ